MPASSFDRRRTSCWPTVRNARTFPARCGPSWSGGSSSVPATKDLSILPLVGRLRDRHGDRCRSSVSRCETVGSMRRRSKRGPVEMSFRRPFTRYQLTTVVSGMLAFVLMLVVLQLWLLTATMNAYLGGDRSVIWPAAIASLVCLVLNVGLLRYLYQMDRMRR